jgi:hypothetical protein
VCRSPDCILSLRKALLQAATNELDVTTPNPAGGPGQTLELWLRRFVSASGKALGDDQKDNLLRLFKQWTSGQDIPSLKADALSWGESPLSFCDRAPKSQVSNNSELIEVYIDEYEFIERTSSRNRPRRRFILFQTFLLVREEERIQERLSRQKRRKTTPKLSQSHSREPSFRSRAVRSISQRLWGERFSPEKIEERKKRLLRMSRYGEKWSLIKPSCIILGLGGDSQL